MLDDPSACSQLVEARSDHVRAAAKHDIFGHGQEQGSNIRVTSAQDGVDLERRPARVGGFNNPCLVHDALEHREGPDAHALNLARDDERRGRTG